MAGPVDLFISYAPCDEDLRNEFVEHLATMKRERVIRLFDPVLAGEDYRETIDRRMGAAPLVVLLLSASYVASDYLHDVEMTRAIERAKKGQARVIPVLLRAFDLGGSLLAGLLPLPQSGLPVTSWSNRDEAWCNVVLDIRRTIGEEARLHIWRRRGSEAQTEDWDAGNRDFVTKAEAASLLAEYLGADLPDEEEARSAALDAAAEAYTEALTRRRDATAT